MSLPKLKLISHKLCPYVQRARIVLHEKGIPYDLEFIDLANKPDWFLELSPLGKVPVLLVDGEPLFESAVIAEYLDEITPPPLLPREPFDRAQHRAWIEFASATLANIGAFYSAPDEAELARQRDALRAKFERLEQELGDGPFFAGDAFSLVDAAFAPVFRYFDVFDRIADFGLFAGTPKLNRWRRALATRPSVIAAAVGDYPQRLHGFLRARQSALGERARARRAA